VTAVKWLLVFDRRDVLHDKVGNVHFSQLADVSERCVSLDGENSGDDGDVDASGFAVFDVVDEVVRVEEELSDDEVRTRDHFLFQVKQVVFIRRAVGVAIRISGGADVEMIAESFPDEFDQVGGVVKAVGISLPVLLTHGRISAQRQNIANSLALDPFEMLLDLGTGHAAAGHVQHRLEADVVEHGVGDRDAGSGLFGPRIPSRMPRDVAEQRTPGTHVLEFV